MPEPFWIAVFSIQLIVWLACVVWFVRERRARRRDEAATQIARARRAAETAAEQAALANRSAEASRMQAMHARFERDTRAYVREPRKPGRPSAASAVATAPDPQPDRWSTWPSAFAASSPMETERKDSAPPIVSGGGGDFGGAGASGSWDSGSSCGDAGSSASCSSSSD